MKKIFAVIFILSHFQVHADSWTQMTSFPGIGRGHPFSFSIGNKGYMGAGDAGTDDFWEFDPALNTWTQKADYGGGSIYGAAGFSIGNKGYAATGGGGIQLWEYDTAINTWQQKADFPGAGRYYAAAFSIGTKGYVGGGLAGLARDDFWEWDQLTDTWTQKSNLLFAISYSVGFSINDKGYFSTGRNNTTSLTITWEYDTLTNSWTQKADFPGIERMDAAAFVVCGKGYVGLGGELPYYNDFWQFDPVQNQWIQKTSFPGTVRDDAVFFAIGNKGYMGMGQYNNVVNYNDFWEYTPDSACSMQPVALFTAPNHVCPGSCIDFINNSENAISFLWSFPGANPAVSTDENPQNICYYTPGSYDVQLIVSNAAGSDTLYLTNYISVYPAPPPQGIFQNGDTLFANPGAISYQWYYNGNSIAGATGYYFIAQSSGDYNVVATDGNGCEVEAVINDVIADILQISSSEIRIIPEPLKNSILLKGIAAGQKIHIWNATGSEIFHGLSTSTQAVIPIRNAAPGIYFLRLTGKDKNICKKIFIE